MCVMFPADSVKMHTVHPKINPVDVSVYIRALLCPSLCLCLHLCICFSASVCVVIQVKHGTSKLPQWSWSRWHRWRLSWCGQARHVLWVCTSLEDASATILLHLVFTVTGTYLFPPASPPRHSIQAMMIVFRITGKIIRTVLCFIVLCIVTKLWTIYLGGGVFDDP